MAVVVPLALARRVDECGGTAARLGEALGPISPELALVDPELAARARALLPDPVEPARRPPARIHAPEPLEPPEPLETPEPPEPVVAVEPLERFEPLRFPEPPEPRAAEALETSEASVPPDGAPVVDAAPAARPLSSRPAVRVVAVAVLLLTVGLAAWRGLAPGGEQQPTAGSGEAPLEFSAPSSDPSLGPAAVAALERQVRSEPRSPLLREKLGTAYLRLGRWQDAERELRALVALAPRDAFAHFALGRALDEQGRRAEAKRHFARAEELGRDGSSAVPLSP